MFMRAVFSNRPHVSKENSHLRKIRETGGENIGSFEEHWKALREVLARQSK
jgi:hypothetical protein